MLSEETRKLERENDELRTALLELGKKMEENGTIKPKSCQYCRHYIQHYAKHRRGGMQEYFPIYAGHCSCNVPIRNGRKRNPKPDDSCNYFELGTFEMKYL